MSEEKSKSSAIDPKHYNRFEIEPIEFIQRNNLDFVQGNVIKYICRYKYKNGAEDLRKLIQYANFALLEYDREKAKDFTRTTALGVFIALTNLMNDGGDISLARNLPCTIDEAWRLFRMVIRDRELKSVSFMLRVTNVKQFDGLSEEQKGTWADVMDAYQDALTSGGIIGNGRTEGF